HAGGRGTEQVIARLASRAGVIALALAALAAVASAAPAGPKPSRANPAKPASARRAVARPSAADSADATPSATRTGGVPGKAGTRTLDDIHIEGEIPVPQVLFITAREQRRFMEFQHHRYARTSLELGRGTAMPSRVVVPEPNPAERKENQR